MHNNRSTLLLEIHMKRWQRNLECSGWLWLKNSNLPLHIVFSYCLSCC